MDRIVTYNFTEDFIVRFADYLEENFLSAKRDLSSLAVVFGGKRPSLFLKRELARRFNSSYFPPQCFTVEEFIERIVSKKTDVRLVSPLDSCYLIYKVTRQKAARVLRDKREFSQFLPWAKEIASFIDELDLEDVGEEALKNIEMSAEIGYEVPKSINELLEHIVVIRRFYHEALRQRHEYSRGLMYREAARLVRGASLDEFTQIFFCNFFYLHKTEEKILAHLYETGKAVLFFQKDTAPWPVFKSLEKVFGASIEPLDKSPVSYEVKIYKGFDTHSQVGLVREIVDSQLIKKKANLNKTLILLSDPHNLIPLLSEVSSRLEDFNVSLGYPLKRSSLYALFQHIFTAQSRRKDGAYYSRDYLRVILHPLFKNLMVGPPPSVTRILCHKVEEVLLGMAQGPLSGSLFVKLDDIENFERLYLFAAETLTGMGIRVDSRDLGKILSEIHQLGFRLWEEIGSFAAFLDSLQQLMDAMVLKSLAGSYPLNNTIMERIYGLIDELKNAEFKEQPFEKDELFKIFNSRMEDENIAFAGSPLKGLQILGLLETRALSFTDVIVMDANEAVLPKVRVYEPLIPRQIMEGLGLQRLRQEEEIQRYHFRRLISGAKKVYFVYDDNPEKEKSRFLEEIVWQRQKEKGELKVLIPSRARFKVAVAETQKAKARKREEVVEYLTKSFVYSASSVDTYLNCPLKFYYQYVLNLEEKEDLLGEPESRDIGTFIHELLDHLFREFLHRKPVIDEVFEKKFFAEFSVRFSDKIHKRMGAEAFMVREVMEHRLRRFLDNERSRGVKELLSLEEEMPQERLHLAGRNFKFRYRIDRIDLLEDESILIIDYKTGASVKPAAGIDKLEGMEFDRLSIRDALHSFQLPLYYYFVRERYKDRSLNAALYNLQKIELAHFIKPGQISAADQLMGICLEALGAVMEEIISPALDFEADDSQERNCDYCTFSMLCKRR